MLRDLSARERTAFRKALKSAVRALGAGFPHGSFGLAADRARVGNVQKSKKPDGMNPSGFLFWRCPTLARPVAALPSGLQRFTAVFGMGTGGTTAL